jgi:hypothetical protein
MCVYSKLATAVEKTTVNVENAYNYSILKLHDELEKNDS